MRAAKVDFFQLGRSIVAMACAAAGAPAWAQSQSPVAAGTPATGTVTGLALPRFVSLKSDEVNLRSGPGRDYPTQWVYRRAGLPVEVIGEFESWRQVRDADGVTGWISQSLLSGRRTALVLPWEAKAGAAPPQVPLRDDDSEKARAVVMLEAGVIASVLRCDSRWCLVTVGDWRGYLEQKKLWGVYQSEMIR